MKGIDAVSCARLSSGFHSLGRSSPLSVAVGPRLWGWPREVPVEGTFVLGVLVVALEALVAKITACGKAISLVPLLANGIGLSTIGFGV